MSNLIEKTQALSVVISFLGWNIDEVALYEKIKSLPLQQWGNEKIKDLIEKKKEWFEQSLKRMPKWHSQSYDYKNNIRLLAELLKEIDNLSPNN
jgi:hypothetical protein